MRGFPLYILVLIYLIYSGLSPQDRFTWWLEVSWVIVGLMILGYHQFYRKTRTQLQNQPWLTSSLKIALFLHALILIYGGHYTYELVPFGEWMKVIFGFERNHYDRIGHVAQGLFPAVLIREVLFRYNATPTGFWRELFVFCACMAFTGLFEVLEYAAAIAFGGASDAYLGSQGDPWDAQNDMVMCGVGTIASIVMWRPLHLKELDLLKGEGSTGLNS